MKVTDKNFDFSGNTKYTCNGSLYVIVGEDLYLCEDNKIRAVNWYRVSLQESLNMEFEEVVDWSRLKKDDKVEVLENIGWDRSHFCKYENGEVFVYTLGRSSFTSIDGFIKGYPADKVRLYKEDSNE